MKTDPFIYVAEGYTYRLALVFRINSTKHIRIVGAEMYGKDNNRYYGYWERHNIPMNLVYQMEMRARWLYSHGQYVTGENGYLREATK